LLYWLLHDIHGTGSDMPSSKLWAMLWEHMAVLSTNAISPPTPVAEDCATLTGHRIAALGFLAHEVAFRTSLRVCLGPFREVIVRGSKHFRESLGEVLVAQVFVFGHASRCRESLYIGLIEEVSAAFSRASHIPDTVSKFAVEKSLETRRAVLVDAGPRRP